jgi:hypothetical protein
MSDSASHGDQKPEAWPGVRHTPPDAEQRVAALPRRVAHATYALLEASRVHNSPVTVSEIMIYDSEALSTSSTSSALQRARKLDLAVLAGRYWIPALAATDLREAFEERFLSETD